MCRPIRFAINGFGRIGRAVARQWVEQQAEGRFDLVAINDIAPFGNLRLSLGIRQCLWPHGGLY